MKPIICLFAAVWLGCCILALSIVGCGSDAASPGEDTLVGLITKTDANPFFVTMKEGALERAEELGVELRAYSGQYDGDWESQARAVEELVEDGARGILITPSDPAALSGVVKTAREAGALVIALDTPFERAGEVDGVFATDNFKAGELIGRWARAKMDASGSSARIAMLDGYQTLVTVDALRNQGFLNGFGIDIEDPDEKYDEDDSRIVGSGVTMGTEAGGRSAMESLMRKDPAINLVYAINEPAAKGAYEALREMGMAEDALIVTIDGGCSGVRSVAVGEFAATSMQYPLRMARLGVEAVVEYSKTGKRPGNTPGLDFYDTGVSLVAEEAVPRVPSISADQGLRECWGDSR